nr:hypothetical protein [Tanacetum cinerariifolium]
MDTTIDQQVALDEALEFWATATIHHHSIRFKMDNKKHIVNLESFREIGEIRKLTDVNINKLHHPWRSFAAIINKCLTEKSSGYDSLRLSQAQILWGLYHKRNVDFAYLMWEDFVYQVEHKDTKKSNEMDDHMFTTIKLVSRHQNTQQFGALLPIELTNEDIRNSNAYKEYYAFATGATPPKPKASVRKTRSSSDTTITPPTTAAGPRLTTSEKGKQAAKASKAKSLSALSEVAMTEVQQMNLATKRSQQQTHISQASGSGADEGTGSIPGVLDVPTDKSEEELSWNSMDEEGDDDDDQEDEGDDGKDDEEEGGDDEQASDKEEFIHPNLSTHAEEETKDEESFDPIPKTPKNSDDEGNGEENLRTNVGREEGHDEEEKEGELYKDVNINLERGIQLGDVRTTQEVEDSHVTLTPVNPDGQQQSSSVSSQFVTSMLNPTPDAGIESIFETTSQMDVQTPTSVAPLPMSAPTLTSSTIATIITTQQAPLPPTTASSTLLQDLPNFGSLNLYKALVDAYESDKIILDIYGDTVTLKRRRDDDADKDKEPFAGSDRGSKRRREGKEPESASAPKEKATRSAGKSTQGSKSR